MSNQFNQIYQRLFFIKLIIVVMCIIITIKMIWLAITGYIDFNNNINISNHKHRFDILDRKGNILALNIPIVSVYINPKDIQPQDKDLIVDKLSSILELNKSSVYNKVYSNRSFVWIKRNITKKQELELKYLGIIGLHFQNEQKRFYPYGSLFSHILGITDIDGKGISGVEAYFNSMLYNQNITLSLDVKFQQILHEELLNAKNNNQAKAVYGMIINPNTFEVLAAVSLPDFNPNYRSSINPQDMFNYNTQAVFEPGSIAKIFSVAMFLDSKITNIYEAIDVSKPIVKNKFIIVDYSYMDKELILPEILMYSSNVGVALLTNRLGYEEQRKYFYKFNLFKTPSLEVMENENPLMPTKWDDLSSMVMSYGYGYAITQSGFSNAFIPMINGGYYKPITLLLNSNSPSQRVITKETSRQIRAMLRLTVAGGFGKKSDVGGYSVGGKTGSSEKQVNGKYDFNKVIASFVGFFPVYDPQYMVIISIDEPKRVSYNNYNITGGSLSAPVANNVIDKIGYYMGIPKKDDGISLLNKKDQHVLQEYVENMPDMENVSE